MFRPSRNCTLREPEVAIAGGRWSLASARCLSSPAESLYCMGTARASFMHLHELNYLHESAIVLLLLRETLVR